MPSSSRQGRLDACTRALRVQVLLKREGQGGDDRLLFARLVKRMRNGVCGMPYANLPPHIISDALIIAESYKKHEAKAHNRMM